MTEGHALALLFLGSLPFRTFVSDQQRTQMSRDTIFIVDDEAPTRRLLEHAVGTMWGYRVQSFDSGEECIAHLDDSPNLIILDIMMKGMSGVETLKAIRERNDQLPIIMLSAQEKIDVAVETMRLGARDYFPKPVDLRKLEFAIRNALDYGRMAVRVQELQDTIERSVQGDGIITHSRAMAGVLTLVKKASNSDIGVLIQGESGTGKEMIARALHFNGRRRNGPFVVINCAAIPGELLESELFGHEKGAFTGAHRQKPGRFEQADGGSLFLDEVGELAPALQAKLLRVLQEKTFERVGGNETLEADVRIIAATNRDLRQLALERNYREDLYYRLAGFPIELPPLRDRREEIPHLVDHFLRMFEGREGRKGLKVTREAMDVLMEYPWPGNIRELRSIMERAVLIADGAVITPQDLPMAPPTESLQRSFLAFATPEHIVSMERVKEEAIRQTLRLVRGNVTETARRLGIGRTSLYEMLKKYGIETT